MGYQKTTARTIGEIVIIYIDKVTSRDRQNGIDNRFSEQLISYQTSQPLAHVQFHCNENYLISDDKYRAERNWHKRVKSLEVLTCILA